MGSQTDTHILDHNIVKSYEWNEWELRRKALKMVCSYYLNFSLKLEVFLVLLSSFFL